MYISYILFICENMIYDHLCVCVNLYLFTLSVLNKFKRRKFLKTKNLLTGETEADPEMIKVDIFLFYSFLFCTL